jgi:hemoglobin
MAATTALPDLVDREDIVVLVNRFYDRIRKDGKLGPVFNEVVKINWETHLPKMYDFWDTVLFRAGTFRGNPLAAHAKLVPLTDMGRATFDHWLTHFRATVAELFEGPNAGHLVRCAEDMANVIYSKINAVPDPRFDPAQLTDEQRARYAAYRQPSVG